MIGKTAAPVAGRLLSGGLAIALVTIPSGTPAQTAARIAVTGTLTSEGVPCRALRGEDGVLYTFRRSRVSDEFAPGDRVRVEGTVAEVSICQQGTTIVVTKAEKINK